MIQQLPILDLFRLTKRRPKGKYLGHIITTPQSPYNNLTQSLEQKLTSGNEFKTKDELEIKRFKII